MLATMIEDMLRDLGCEVVKAARVRKGLQLAATGELAGAILDINVNGEMVFPIARLLRERGIPFVFSSGYGAGKLPVEFCGVPLLSKPFEEDELEPLLIKTFAAAKG
jgi:DNA-binding response OmpR family regulator